MNRDQLLNLSLTDLSLKELVALIKRRRWTIIVTTIIALVLGTVASLLMSPTWRASKLIIVEGRTQSNSGAASDIVGALTQTSVDYDVLTQIQIMSGYDVLFKALNKIDFKMPSKLDDDAVQKLPKVQIQQVQTTNTVLLTVEYKNDQQAVDLASAIPQVYEEQIRDTQQDQVKRSFEFVTERVKEERQNLQTQLEAIAAYKTERGVVDSKSETEIRVGAYAEATRKLNDAISDVATAQEALREIESQQKTMPKVVENPVSITPTEYINRAKETIEGLKSQRDALLVNNTESSDRVKRIDAQISSTQAYLESLQSGKMLTADSKIQNPLFWEIEKNAYTAKANLEGALSRKRSYEQMVEEKRGLMKDLAPITAKLLEMETQTSEVEQQITRLLGIQNDIRLRNNALQSPVRDLTGKTPAQFVRPILPLNLAVAALAGLVLGLIFALVRDISLEKVNSSTEAVTIAEKEILGRIPLRASSRSALIADPQKARAFEAYRVLRNSVTLAGQGKKAFVVTSTVSKEGKTTVAGNLAVAMALDGKRTVLVDGNLRNPAIHKLFKVDQAKGVTEVLGGTLNLDEALKSTEVTNLAILTAGAEATNSTELVSSKAMEQMIEKLKNQADIIIIDAPAAFGFADTQSLVTVVKDVLYITHLETPSKPQMREAIGMIDFAGGDALGIILNKDKLAISRSKAV